MKGAILVCGTHSDAGKSTVVAGLCRHLARQGIRVAPFKAQNMSLNSVVTADGREVARAQALQADAAGVPVQAEMNPILLKPSGERESQVVVLGRPYKTVSAGEYRQLRAELAPIVWRSLAKLREAFDVVVCEGAGGAAEINLRDGDLTNLGLARAHRLPVVLVTDIERGGAFASLYGTYALLDEEDRDQIGGFVINRFRGDPALLGPGIEELAGRTGVPCLGVLPYHEGLRVDAEDSQGLVAEPPPAAQPDRQTLDVAVLRLRLISNFTDLDALALEPSVRLRFTRSPLDLRRADLVVIPGTKATVRELWWLQEEGLDRVLRERAAGGGPILGICGGYQLLGEEVIDEVETKPPGGRVVGLGLLPVTTQFGEEKVLRRRGGHCPLLGCPVGGYEVRHGRPCRHGGAPLFVATDGEEEGTYSGVVYGTSWHGALEHDAFRAAFLAAIAAHRSVPFTPSPRPFAQARLDQIEAVCSLVEENLDLEAVYSLIEKGASIPLEVAR